MRYAAAEKIEIIQLVEQSSLPVRTTLAQLGISKSTFYAWYRRYLDGGTESLEDCVPAPGQVWNKVPEKIREEVIKLALEQPERSPRELATAFTDQRGYFVSESTVYQLLKALDLITSPAFILMQAAGLNQTPAQQQRPRLLSDNGPSYVSSELGQWLQAQCIGHTRGKPYHQMTQGKIERYHRSMKNHVLLENYYYSGYL